jgi:hypothetical protein
MIRQCKKCGEEKELTEDFFCLYNRKMRDGSCKKYFRIYCRKCEKISSRKYREANPDYTKNYNSLESTKENRKKWLKENNYCEKRKEYYKEYYLKNKDKVKEYCKQEYVKKNKYLYKKNRLKNDVCFKMRSNISNSINKALKKSKTNKGGRSILKYLGYSIIDLRNHLENKFDSNMNWDNYGVYWHIDHIIPQSCLPYKSMEDENFKKCWSLQNLRPLEAKQNILDGATRVRHKMFQLKNGDK